MSQQLINAAISRLALDRAIVDALEARGLRLSNVLFDVRRTPDTVADGSFCVELQSIPTGRQRQQDEQEVAETCIVRILHRIPPLDQHNARRDAYAAEEDVLAALYSVSNFPQCRIAHRGTTHTVVNDNAFFVTEIRFDITHFQLIT